MTRGFLLLMLCAVATLCAPVAWGHALLKKTSPSVNAVLAHAPSEIRLWFTEKLEARFSRVELLTAMGAAIADGGVDSQRPHEMVLRVPSLAPGHYLVRWRIISVDTHKVSGEFAFELKP